MDAPILTSYLSGKSAEQVIAFIAEFKKAVEAKHIWNTDYQTGKDYLSRRAEEAVDKLNSEIRAKRPADYDRPQWDNTDIRWQTVYTPSFMNFPGTVKKFQKFKNDPHVAPLLPLFTEVAQIAELIKSVKPFIEKGRKPNPNAKPIDLTNMGTCAICFNMQKLDEGKKMVAHGYQISDGMGHYFGFRSGSCFGVDYHPYELSCEANKKYKVVLDENLVKVEQRLVDLQSGAITEIVRMEQKWKKGEGRDFGRYVPVAKNYKVGDREWEGVLDLETREVEYAVRAIKDEIATQVKRIGKWTKKPLPDQAK